MFNKKKIKEIEKELRDLRWTTQCLDSRIDRQAFIVVSPEISNYGYMVKEKRVSIDYVLRYILKELGLELKYKCKPKVTTYIKKKIKKGGKR